MNQYSRNIEYGINKAQNNLARGMDKASPGMINQLQNQVTSLHHVMNNDPNLIVPPEQHELSLDAAHRAQYLKNQDSLKAQNVHGQFGHIDDPN